MHGYVSRVQELDSFDVHRQQNTHKETERQTAMAGTDMVCNFMYDLVN